MKPQRVTAIVVHEHIPEDGELGEAQLLLPGGEIRYIRTDQPLGPGAKVQLFQTLIPRKRDELIEHMLHRCPTAQRGRLRTALTREYKNVVMLMDGQYIVIQRRGPQQHGSIFDYSPAGVTGALEKFFDEVKK
jgi:hypothetical protein